MATAATSRVVFRAWPCLPGRCAAPRPVPCPLTLFSVSLCSLLCVVAATGAPAAAAPVAPAVPTAPKTHLLRGCPVPARPSRSILSCRPIVALGASSCVQLCVLLLAFQCAAFPLPAISCPVHLPTSPRRLCPYASSAPLLVPWHLPFASCAVAHSAALCLCLPFC